MKLTLETLEKLKKLAKKESVYDDLAEDDFYDASGTGNYDDCFNYGIEEGEIQLAREIIKSLGANNE